jgi:hypothetical protein
VLSDLPISATNCVHAKTWRYLLQGQGEGPGQSSVSPALPPKTDTKGINMKRESDSKKHTRQRPVERDYRPDHYSQGQGTVGHDRPGPNEVWRSPRPKKGH